MKEPRRRGRDPARARPRGGSADEPPLAPLPSRGQGATEALFDAVLAVVRRIPRGRVATYGEVAELAGRPGAARAVGRILSGLDPERFTRVPWQRVVNASGGISRRPGAGPDLQRRRLEREGVRLDRAGRVDLDRHRWRRAALVSTARLREPR